MLLNLPHDVTRRTARFRLRVSPYVLRQQHGIKVTPALMTYVILMMSKMSSMFSFPLYHPHVISLRRKYASLFPPAGAHDVSTFLSQNNNKLIFPLWGAMYEHLRVVPPGKRLRVPSCTRPDILGSG
jgi:hypothetical protein